MYGVSSLIVPFIALCFLIPFMDGIMIFLEAVMRRIPWLPNRFWGPIAYVIASAMAFLICWRGHFNFFGYLGFTFEHDYEGWFCTASLLGAGSGYVKKAFGQVNTIPQVISNVYSMATGFLSSGATTASSTENEIASEPTTQETGGMPK